MGAGSIQLQARRGSFTQMSNFIGASGEVTVDITSCRTVLHDGVTAGGWPQERAGLTKISDVNYTVLPTDVVVMFTSLTAARTVTLCPNASYPTGQKLTIVDATGTSSSNIITVTAASTKEFIVASTSFAISATSTASSFNHLSLVATHGIAAGLTSTGGTINASTAIWSRC